MAHSDSPRRSRLFVGSLAKGIEVLKAFDASRPAMSLPQLAAAAGISKSAAQRFAYTFAALGYLRKDATTKLFRLSPRVLEFGLRLLESEELIERANPFLQELSARCGESCNLSLADELEMVYVARFPSPKQIPVHVPIGRRFPMFCTASGRAYLALLAEAESSAILRRSALTRYTPSTVVSLAALRALVAEARRAGFAFADGEYYRGDLNVAAAVLGRNGRPVGAINIAAPSSRWTLDVMKRDLAPLVVQTAQAIGNAPPAAGDANGRKRSA